MTNRFLGSKRSLSALCCSVAVLLLLAPTHTQSQTLTEQKQTVVFIFGTITKKMPDGKSIGLESALGTGFLVYYPDVRLGPDKGFVYLVTAMHVLRDSDGKFLPHIRVRLNLQHPDADGREYDFVENVPVTDKDGKLLWFHSGTGEDLAVYPFLPDGKKYEEMRIPISMFSNEASLKADNVQEGDSLYFIGLMGAYYGYNRNYPVIRRGTLAMMTPEKIQTSTGPQKVFIAELSSWPGNSGSPVFLSIGGVRGSTLMLGQKLGLLGILLGGFVNGTPMTVVGQPNTRLFVGDNSEIGVSYVLPADSILQILNGPDAQANRDWQVAQSKQAKH
jgi:hypothetical protein